MDQNKINPCRRIFPWHLELTDEDTSMILLYGEDSTRPLMDRVYDFASKITKHIAIFDTKKVELPVDEDFVLFSLQW